MITVPQTSSGQWLSIRKGIKQSSKKSRFSDSQRLSKEILEDSAQTVAWTEINRLVQPKSFIAAGISYWSAT